MTTSSVINYSRINGSRYIGNNVFRNINIHLTGNTGR